MSDKPQGKEAVRSALVRSAAALFAKQGIASVSIRDIALRANVNHGLVHRHFGSKRGLIIATIESLSKGIASSMGPAMEAKSLRSLLASSFVKTSSNQEYWRVLAHLMLTEGGEELLQPEFPLVARMIEVAQDDVQGKLSAEARVTLMLSVGLGMMVFRPYLQRAIGTDDAGWVEIQRELLVWGSSQNNTSNHQQSGEYNDHKKP
jgi:TetR/AcrR family transcriptional regulator, repressor for neighboring sulfatase